MNSYLIIGISGVTCGGKTTLAKNISEIFKDKCIIFNQDYYFYPDDSPNHVKVKNMDHNNYDILSSLNMDKMYKDILDVINKPVQNDNKIIIIEGFTILNYEPIAKLCHLKFQLVLDVQECKRRRDLRTYDPPDIPGYFEQCAWPEYLKYCEELKNDTNIMFLNGTDNDLLKKVTESIIKSI